MSVNNQCNDEKTALFKSLSDVGQSYRESLDGCERVLEVQGVGVLINPPKLHHLLPGVFYLEVLGGLLGHPTSEVELVDLASFIPQRSFIMHHELPGISTLLETGLLREQFPLFGFWKSKSSSSELVYLYQHCYSERLHLILSHRISIKPFEFQ